MSDSFNPHELLNKLRAKSSSSVSVSVTSNAMPTPTSSQRAASGQISNTSSPRSFSSVRSAPKSSPLIRAPASFSLTPSQRQENLNARLELEREIKRLQTEMVALRTENVQLRTDKEDVEQQLVEYRIKSEDTITKLRGKIASVVINSGGVADRGSGAGKMYPPTHNFFNSNVSAINNSSVGRSFPGPGRSPEKSRPPPPPSAEDLYRQMSAPGGSFRDPTFSELMRR
jgi:hypothetical protein